MDLRLNILPPAQLALWEKFKEGDLSGFVLYGGTAVALRYGHRESVDFDFFFGHSVSPEFIFQRLPWVRIHLQTVLQSQKDTFVVSTTVPSAESEGFVKLSFFGNLPLAFVHQPEPSASGVAIASPEDLLATKLKVINQRIEAKDYLDIEVLLKNSDDPTKMLKQGLANMLALYPEAAPAETLKALCWFRGGDLDRLDGSTKDYLTAEVAKVDKLPPASINPNHTLRNFYR